MDNFWKRTRKKDATEERNDTFDKPADAVDGMEEGEGDTFDKPADAVGGMEEGGADTFDKPADALGGMEGNEGDTFDKPADALGGMEEGEEEEKEREEEFLNKVVGADVAERATALAAEAEENKLELSASPQEGIEVLKQIMKATPSQPVPVEIYDLIMRGLSYAVDIAKAYADGEVAGRNSRIEQLVEIARKPVSDGIPDVKGHPNRWFGEGKDKPDSIFRLASMAR